MLPSIILLDIEAVFEILLSHSNNCQNTLSLYPYVYFTGAHEYVELAMAGWYNIEQLLIKM